MIRFSGALVYIRAYVAIAFIPRVAGTGEAAGSIGAHGLWSAVVGRTLALVNVVACSGALFMARLTLAIEGALRVVTLLIWAAGIGAKCALVDIVTRLAVSSEAAGA